MDRTDAELIDEYVRGPKSDLGELIRRHIDLVYSAAVRMTGDPSLADDITQAVFLVLMKKAKSLRSHATIAGWLLVVTRHVARTALRSRARRKAHEQAAARTETGMQEKDTQALERVLDEALSCLPARDRDALTLRYLQSRSLFDVGEMLGVSEEAARKRVSRAVERLRSMLTRRQVTLGVAALSSSLTGFAASPAPAATLDGVLSLPSAPASSTAVSLSKGTLLMLTVKKLSLVVAIVLLALSTIGAVVMAQSLTGRPVSAPIARAAPPDVNVNSMALSLKVSDVEANIDFLAKIGFKLIWSDTPDADGKLPRASVRSGNVSIRLDRAPAPRPSDSMSAFFWVDGNEPALAKLRDEIIAQGVLADPITNSGPTLRQFDVKTPDGYTVGFFSMP